MKNTASRQRPFIYGSLGGSTVAIVDAAAPPEPEARVAAPPPPTSDPCSAARRTGEAPKRSAPRRPSMIISPAFQPASSPASRPRASPPSTQRRARNPKRSSAKAPKRRRARCATRAKTRRKRADLRTNRAQAPRRASPACGSGRAAAPRGRPGRHLDRDALAGARLRAEWRDVHDPGQRDYRARPGRLRLDLPVGQFSRRRKCKHLRRHPPRQQRRRALQRQMHRHVHGPEELMGRIGEDTRRSSTARAPSTSSSRAAGGEANG